MPLTKKFEHLRIELKAIESATNNFDDHNRIGREGFGKVYKGELVHSKGRTIVAVKRLDPAFGQGNPEFWREIIMLSLYKHENIVSLLGFCDERNEKILVYEYASRSSLDLYLNNDALTWIQRLKICIGEARGLAYLHNPGRTEQRILHRDIKSSNILLDESWNAKISDLGLSKFGPANQKYTFLVSSPIGTIGYCDPLYVETGLLTKESDVYSFGVVLFEVLSGRLCISNKDDIHQSLIALVRQYYIKNKLDEIIYANIKDGINGKSLEAFITIAYRCLNRELEDRPLMIDVVRTLEGALEFQHGTGSALTMCIGTQLESRLSREEWSTPERAKPSSESSSVSKISTKLQLHHEMFSLNPSSQQINDYAKKVIEIMSKWKNKNPILVGDFGIESVKMEVMIRIKQGDLSPYFKDIEVGELSPYFKKEEVIFIEYSQEKSQIAAKIKEVRDLIDIETQSINYQKRSIIIDLGDLKWLVEPPPVAGVCKILEEMTELVAKSRYKNIKLWMIGSATCENYLRCQVYHPSMEHNLELSAVPISSRPPLAGM